nr:MAG TPA: DNA pilot protein VP2 [Microviridae sp.]
MLDFIFNFLVGLLTYQDSSFTYAIAPVVGAALINGGASLLGGIFGSKSQSDANKTNLQIARETNALNYKMFNEQNAYNKEMWQLNNEYNDPSNQASRLQAAGFNPYLSGDVTSGSSSSAPLSASLPNLVTPQIQPNMSLPNALQQVGSVLSSIPLQQAQLDNVYSDTFSTLINAYVNAKSAGKDWKTKDIQNWILGMTKDNMVTRSNYDAKIARQEWLQSVSNTKAAEAEAAIKDWTSFMLPETSVVDLNYKVAQVMLTNAQANESYERAQLAAAQVIKETLLAEGVRLSNDQIRKLTPLIVDSQEYKNLIDSERLYYYQNYGDEKAPFTAKGSLNIFGFPAVGFGAGISGEGTLPAHKGHSQPKKNKYYVPHGSSGTW